MDHLLGSAAVSRSKRVLPLDTVEHPCNLAFTRALARSFVKTIGIHLSQLFSGEALVAAAAEVQWFFKDELGGDGGVFGGPSEMTLQQFTARLAMLELGSTDIPCMIQRNLGWLRDALVLSAVEVQALRWAYCLYRDTSGTVNRLLNQITYTASATAWTALGLLLDVSPAEVNRWLNAPCRLVGLGLLTQSPPWPPPLTVARHLQPSRTLIYALEMPYRSTAGLVHALTEAESSWLFEIDPVPDSVVFTELFPLAAATAYARTANHQSLTADDIVALVEWWSQHRLTQAACTALAGHLDFWAIQRAIRRCFVDASVSRDATRRVTHLRLLQRYLPQPYNRPRDRRLSA